ncbi:DUF411 domain-containing protein [Cupriavidus gilardii]
MVEGHVPAAAVRKLAATPALKGVAVPGMRPTRPAWARWTATS